MEQSDDIGRLVRHCDLPKVLRLADELKHQKRLLKTLTSGEGGTSLEVGTDILAGTLFVCFLLK